jgi:hypothetical protein
VSVVDSPPKANRVESTSERRLSGPVYSVSHAHAHIDRKKNQRRAIVCVCTASPYVTQQHTVHAEQTKQTVFE